MKSPLEFRTASLRLRLPFGQTLLLAALMLAALAGLAELAARAPAAAAYLPPESIGTGAWQLEVKLARLRALNAAAPVNCLIIGSSQVYRGIDAATVAEAAGAAGSQPLRCFNFGVDSMLQRDAATLIRLLVQQYHPAVIVYGANPSDLDNQNMFGLPQPLAANAWIRYQFGTASVDGWLMTYSTAFRRYLGFSGLDSVRGRWRYQLTLTEMDAAGFGPWLGQAPGASPDIPPAPEDIPEYFRPLAHYQVRPANVTALERAWAQRGRTRVVAVEMPIHPTALYYFGNGRQDYLRGLAVMQQVAAAAKTPFIAGGPDLYPSLPSDGWYDRLHLNRTGAEAYSRWLGGQLAQALRQ